MIQGTIAAFIDHGTIVSVFVDTEEGQKPVHFDHRMFQHLIDGEGNIIGREVIVDGDVMCSQTMEFVDMSDDEIQKNKAPEFS